ncbi:helix-turn-helix domain-containing protein [Mongoliitalea daihaiensis]|uniref:helix-turn-helix domain-containing protein n=1 Tax=Mongoliitalea daihaiensis TaxID=2782006 RepID=UPI001F30AC0A|nr:helix-turn-helix domain-containing protein [Mongoliitalea daihaiensis]UJP65225.1 helix-turn-helix transcriptional regulator [Mongoliitalea daihaiensis]
MSWKDRVHLVPAILIAISYIPVYSMSQMEKWEMTNVLLANPESIHMMGEGYIPLSLMPFLKIFSFLFYTTLVASLMFRFKDLFGLNSSWTWIKTATYFYLGVAFIFILFSFNQIGDLLEVWETKLITTFSFVVIYVLITALNFYIIYYPERIFNLRLRKKGSSFQAILEPQNSTPFLSDLINNRSVKQNTNELANQNTKFNEIDNLIKNEQLFLNKNLTVVKLSKLVGLSSRKLSELIHEQTGKGYSDFINGYRAEFAKEKIMQGYLFDFTIEGLAEQSGFNSRITFYHAFKKTVGMCPSEYHKNIMEGLIISEN